MIWIVKSMVIAAHACDEVDMLIFNSIIGYPFIEMYALILCQHESIWISLPAIFDKQLFISFQRMEVCFSELTRCQLR